MPNKQALQNPFPGLRPFQSDEEHLFFGRENQTLELLQILRDNRFVGVIGTSGSGKSSLVRCGLLSELYGGSFLDAGTRGGYADSTPSLVRWFITTACRPARRLWCAPCETCR